MHSTAPSPTVPPAARTSTKQAYGIVLGCPRSGTTYLSRLLNTIPEFETVVGTLLPVAIPHVVNQPLAPEVYQALAIGFERSLDAYLYSGRYHSRAGALQKWFATPTGIGGLIRALQGKRDLPKRMIYKEPFLAFAPEFVLDAFPDGKILHIYRDGRDAANSLVRTYDVLTDDKLQTLERSEMRIGRPHGNRYVPWWVDEGHEEEFLSSSPYVRAIWMWMVMTRACREAFSQPEVRESGRVFSLRYEDLVREPQEYGRAAIDFFGGTPNRALEKLLANARTSSIGKYKRRDPDEVAAAEAVARTELEARGYAC